MRSRKGRSRNHITLAGRSLNTETTGLAGGSGTYAFLIGGGRITPEGFRLRQFFMRDLGEEASLLHALSNHLAEFDTLVTYNGRRTTSRCWKREFPCPCARRSAHGASDLLFGARRLWKLGFDSCRLVVRLPL